MIRPRDFRWRLALCGAAITLAVAGCTSQAADGATTSGAPERTVTPSVAAPPSTALGSAAVTGSTASPSKSTPPSSPRSSPKPTGSTKPTPTSLDVAAREDADRAAIEAQWVRFWVIYDSIVRTPKESRPGELRKVAVPIRSAGGGGGHFTAGVSKTGIIGQCCKFFDRRFTPV